MARVRSDWRARRSRRAAGPVVLARRRAPSRRARGQRSRAPRHPRVATPRAGPGCVGPAPRCGAWRPPAADAAGSKALAPGAQLWPTGGRSGPPAAPRSVAWSGRRPLPLPPRARRPGTGIAHRGSLGDAHLERHGARCEGNVPTLGDQPKRGRNHRPLPGGLVDHRLEHHFIVARRARQP